MVGNFISEFETVTEYWSPKVVAQVNDQYVKVAKVKGDLAWHKHDGEDELFYIVKGNLTIEYENNSLKLNQGDFHVVPKGVMHNLVADEECWIVLTEPVSTKHTGDIVTEKTKSIADQLVS
ncbi:Cupin domain protein [Pseudovibrio axinellae]|uniref:Cupin domain protein n=1 Tax=Pseudovibrio axinellae TaxID=989403 RepID=A0A165U175_9HYPH|nr:cupin domain-containing protein [Pseudovibrio axinellae]KZL09419.1 Cupin domain protein [Pseudovibrio axinellae]SEQ65482.1 Mannose-6-phosphate isomerase, cupin superfamily [Pseudovibrio axinellae]